MKFSTEQDGQKLSVELVRDTRRSNNYLRNRGGFDIVVNGVVWGRTSMRGIGCHGAKHMICQIRFPDDDGYQISKQGRRKDHPEPLEIWSDKHYLRNLPTGQKPVPFLERLKEVIDTALRTGLIRSPAVMEQRRIEANRRIHEDSLDRERKRDEAMNAMAHATVARVRKDLLGAQEAVIDAMKWAMQNAR